MGNQLERQSLCDIQNCLLKTPKYVNAAISEPVRRHKISLLVISVNFVRPLWVKLGLRVATPVEKWLEEQPTFGHLGRPDFIIRSPAMPGCCIRTIRLLACYLSL